MVIFTLITLLVVKLRSYKELRGKIFSDMLKTYYEPYDFALKLIFSSNLKVKLSIQNVNIQKNI